LSTILLTEPTGGNHCGQTTITHRIYVYQIAPSDFIMEYKNIDKEKLLLLIASEPNNAEYYQELGKIYIYEKELELAAKTLHKSLELNFEDGWTYMYLGNIYNHKKNYEQSIGFFEYAARFLPGIATPFWCMAEMYEKLGRPGKARQYFEQAVKVDQSDQDSIKKLKNWQSRYAEH